MSAESVLIAFEDRIDHGANVFVEPVLGTQGFYPVDEYTIAFIDLLERIDYCFLLLFAKASPG